MPQPLRACIALMIWNRRGLALRTCLADLLCGLALRTCFADLLCGLGRPEVLPKLTSALVWPQFYLSVYLQIDFRWYNITALALFPLAIVSLLLSLTFT